MAGFYLTSAFEKTKTQGNNLTSLKQDIENGMATYLHMISLPYQRQNIDPDGTFIWDLDFPDLLNGRCRHKVYENMDLESQDPRFNANLGLDQNSIWTKNLRYSHSISRNSTQWKLNNATFFYSHVVIAAEEKDPLIFGRGPTTWVPTNFITQGYPSRGCKLSLTLT